VGGIGGFGIEERREKKSEEQSLGTQEGRSRTFELLTAREQGV
jgi:hypothetical protein